jgi:hypothetical protein
VSVDLVGDFDVSVAEPARDLVVGPADDELEGTSEIQRMLIGRTVTGLDVR